MWKLDYRRLRNISFHCIWRRGRVKNAMRYDGMLWRLCASMVFPTKRKPLQVQAPPAPPPPPLPQSRHQLCMCVVPVRRPTIQTIEKIQKCVPEDEKWETEPRSVTRHLVSIYVRFPYRIVIIGRRDCIMHAPRTVCICYGRLLWPHNGFSFIMISGRKDHKMLLLFRVSMTKEI